MDTLTFILKTLRPFRMYVLGVLLAMSIISINGNITPYLVKLLIDTNASQPKTNLIIAFGAMQFLMIFAWRFSDWCLVHYLSRFRAKTVISLLKQVSKYPYSFFQNHSSGNLSDKISNAFNLIPNILVTTTHQFFQFWVRALITMVILSTVHILFAVALFVWMVYFFLTTYFALKKALPLSQDYASAKSNIWGYLVDHLTNILSIRLFTGYPYEMDILEKANHTFIDVAQTQGFFLMRFYAKQGIIVTIYMIGFLIGLLSLSQKGFITAGDFALVFMLNFKIVEKMFDLTHHLREFVTNWGIISDSIKVFYLPIQEQDKPSALSLVVNKGEIIFDKVQFYYHGQDPLFENKSVMIKPGEKVGLVGYSGSGKSTFIHLILRLFDVVSGKILIDGQNIYDVSKESLLANIGMIPQDPSLFDRSLMENIRYGKLNASDEAVIKAAKKANAHEFIEDFPDKYDTRIGERGVKISGGQRQRIAIARAILKNAPILLLDEATSQLDSLTEIKIQKSLTTLMQGKTTLVVAHRLSTLLHMDRILVFDNGKIVQDGHHKKLLRQDGLYKTLWNAQIGGFLPDCTAT